MTNTCDNKVEDSITGPTHSHHDNNGSSIRHAETNCPASRTHHLEAESDSSEDCSLAKTEFGVFDSELSNFWFTEHDSCTSFCLQERTDNYMNQDYDEYCALKLASTINQNDSWDKYVDEDYATALRLQMEFENLEQLEIEESDHDIACHMERHLRKECRPGDICEECDKDKASMDLALKLQQKEESENSNQLEFCKDDYDIAYHMATQLEKEFKPEFTCKELENDKFTTSLACKSQEQTDCLKANFTPPVDGKSFAKVVISGCSSSNLVTPGYIKPDSHQSDVTTLNSYSVLSNTIEPRQDSKYCRSSISLDQLRADLIISQPIHRGHIMRDQASKILRNLNYLDPVSRNRQKRCAERLCDEAASTIFANLNKSLLYTFDVIGKSLPKHFKIQVDFHYLFLKEALPRLHAVINLALVRQWPYVSVVCGKGLHSSRGHATLLYAIQDELNGSLRQFIRKVYVHNHSNICVEMRL